jgi:hypothetical protein
MSLTAKPIVKNKFWVVENNGEQVATIQTNPDGVTYVHKNNREKFVSIKLLKSKYNITFAKEKYVKKKMVTSHQVYGFPCDHKPHNSLLDVSKKLPVYTKTTKSKSFFCAGHYLIKFNMDYVVSYCPKLITLNRYTFIGPFATKSKAKGYLKESKQGANNE